MGTLSDKRPVQWKPDEDDVDRGIIKVVHHLSTDHNRMNEH